MAHERVLVLDNLIESPGAALQKVVANFLILLVLQDDSEAEVKIEDHLGHIALLTLVEILLMTKYLS